MNLLDILDYLLGPGDSVVKADLSYTKLRDDTLQLITKIADDNPNKKRLKKKVQTMFPARPRIVGKYKARLQQLNRRIQRMIPPEK